MKKFHFTDTVTFTKIALKQTRVKTGGFTQISLFDRCNFRISPKIFVLYLFQHHVHFQEFSNNSKTSSKEKSVIMNYISLMQFAKLFILIFQFL